jgi:tetratricopeptide (TPR) repeat protein
MSVTTIGRSDGSVEGPTRGADVRSAPESPFSGVTRPPARPRRALASRPGDPQALDVPGVEAEMTVLNALRRTIAIAVPVLVLAARAGAQDHAHGAIEGLGTVHFPTSCSPAVSARFDRAIALLHSFEFGPAIRDFEGVVAADSTCAMAHWGIALSRWTNPMSLNIRPPALLARGRASADAAARLAAGASERERGWIGAVAKLYESYETVDQRARVLAYEQAMADLVRREPADTEAKVFHAISLVGAAAPTDKSYANLRQAGSILETLWKTQPQHPGLAHYIIHAYDVPALAPLAAEAARRYADIAPSAAHAQHMPSHTFTRVGLWDASVKANRRSREVAARDSSIGEVLHASDYLEYAYLQMRRDADAKSVLETLPALAARFDPNVVRGAAPGSAGVFALAAIPARYAVERRAWREAAALVPKSTAFPYAEAMTHFARALGASHTGALAVARASVDSLAAIERRLRERGEAYWAEQVAIQGLGARAWLALAEGRRDSALAHMREAATREDATEKSAVTPGPLAPARELLGDMLRQVGRPAEALAEYRRTLEKEPRRYRALDGARRAATASGDRKQAAEYEKELRQLTTVAAR